MMNSFMTCLAILATIGLVTGGILACQAASSGVGGAFSLI